MLIRAAAQANHKASKTVHKHTICLINLDHHDQHCVMYTERLLLLSLAALARHRQSSSSILLPVHVRGNFSYK